MKNLIVAFFMTTSFMALSQTSNAVNKAIEIAGEERMLSQKLAKDRVYINNGVLIEEAKKEMEIGSMLFELNIKSLLATSPSEEVTQKINDLSATWSYFKLKLNDQEDDEATKKVFFVNTDLLDQCDGLVQDFVSYSKTLPLENESLKSYRDAISEAVSHSGKLKFLSQRLALYYASYYFDLDKSATEDMNNVALSIDLTLANLKESLLNTGDINTTLNSIYTDWNNLKNPNASGAPKTADGLTDPKQTFMTCKNILAKMDRLSALYGNLTLSNSVGGVDTTLNKE